MLLLWEWVKFLFVSFFSMFMEKNPTKVAGLNLVYVFSISRVIMAAMAFAAFHMVWKIENMGWPDATFAISVVLAPALLAALAKVSPQEALEFGKVLFNRFGIGAVRQDTPADRETLVDRTDGDDPKK